MFKFKQLFNSDYVMAPEAPPKPKAKWRIDIMPLSSTSDKWPYRVERYNYRCDYYDTITWFTTFEEAEAYVAKHFDFPKEYLYPPTVFEDLETK